MMKHEFEALAKVEVNPNVYTRIEAAYMDSPYAKDEFVKKQGKASIIKAYDEELREQNRKLDNLARRAVDALERMNSWECKEPRTGRITNRDLWHRLDVQLDLACDIFEIDRYLEHNELKAALQLHIIY